MTSRDRGGTSLASSRLAASCFFSRSCSGCWLGWRQRNRLIAGLARCGRMRRTRIVVSELASAAPLSQPRSRPRPRPLLRRRHHRPSLHQTGHQGPWILSIALWTQCPAGPLLRGIGAARCITSDALIPFPSPSCRPCRHGHSQSCQSDPRIPTTVRTASRIGRQAGLRERRSGAAGCMGRAAAAAAARLLLRTTALQASQTGLQGGLRPRRISAAALWARVAPPQPEAVRERAPLYSRCMV